MVFVNHNHAGPEKTLAPATGLAAPPSMVVKGQNAKDLNELTCIRLQPIYSIKCTGTIDN